MKGKLTKDERREQRERVEERLSRADLIRTCFIIEMTKTHPDSVCEMLEVYDRAVKQAKGVVYLVDNDFRYDGIEKRKLRSSRRKNND